jgi:uncharacterized DUF497 family protein
MEIEFDPTKDQAVLYYVAFMDRDETMRIISLRRATRQEVKHYVENS